MGKYVDFVVSYYECDFKFHRFFGVLTSQEHSETHSEGSSSSLPSTINGEKCRCVASVRNPFLSKRPASTASRGVTRHRFARIYARLLTWLCAHAYPIAYLLSHLRLTLFANATEALCFYYKLYPDPKRQRVLCLPRAIFAATTSRRFKQHGAMFIGVFLPTVRMHAWVMEDGRAADPYDNQWTCYRPLLMMT